MKIGFDEIKEAIEINLKRKDKLSLVTILIFVAQWYAIFLISEITYAEDLLLPLSPLPSY